MDIIRAIIKLTNRAQELTFLDLMKKTLRVFKIMVLVTICKITIFILENS